MIKKNTCYALIHFDTKKAYFYGSHSLKLQVRVLTMKGEN